MQQKAVTLVRFALVVALLMLSVGCVPLIKAPGANNTVPVTTKAEGAVSPAVAAHNRLLVIGKDGNLFTVAPDGSDRLVLTQDASAKRIYSQPTWSPTAEQIAFGRIEPQQDGFKTALLTSRADGSAQNQVEVPFPPFYLFWSPTGDRLAYLGNWNAGGQSTIALRLLNVARGDSEATTLGLGSPFYFSWSPDGTQLLTHVGAKEIGLLDLSGEAKVLAAEGGHFAAPQWSADGKQLLYAVGNKGKPQLVLADTAGKVQQVVTNVQADTILNFSMNAAGDLLALTETDSPVGANSFGPLFLYDLAGDETQQLTTEPVVAFFWSPNGQSLLFFNAEEVTGRLWLRVQVWDRTGIHKLSRFLPSETFFSQYLRFADQFAQSTYLWAPDGSAVVYAGTGEDGKSGIWVQPVADAAGAEQVADGVYATWSPR